MNMPPIKKRKRTNAQNNLTFARIKSQRKVREVRDREYNKYLKNTFKKWDKEFDNTPSKRIDEKVKNVRKRRNSFLAQLHPSERKKQLREYEKNNLVGEKENE